VVYPGVGGGAQEQFLKYYDAVMPYLKTILTQANRKEQRMLRAKAMECISLIGMAVGKDKFRARRTPGKTFSCFPFLVKKCPLRKAQKHAPGKAPKCTPGKAQ